MRIGSGNNLFKSTLVHKSVLCVIAFLIIFSFGLHVVHLNHHHEVVVYGTGLEAVMHNVDRKWLFALLVVLLTTSFLINKFTSNTQRSFHTVLFNRLVVFFSLAIPKLFNPLQKALRRGIIQTLVYE